IRVSGADWNYMVDYLVQGKDQSWTLDTRPLDSGAYRIDARALFADRWGKWVNIVHFEIGTDEQQQAWRKELSARASARERFNACAASTDRRGNMLALLSDLKLRKTELSAMPARISLALGYNCNLDCLMCDEGRVRRPNRIPPSLVDDVVQYSFPS